MAPSPDTFLEIALDFSRHVWQPYSLQQLHARDVENALTQLHGPTWVQVLERSFKFFKHLALYRIRPDERGYAVTESLLKIRETEGYLPEESLRMQRLCLAVPPIAAGIRTHYDERIRVRARRDGAASEADITRLRAILARPDWELVLENLCAYLRVHGCEAAPRRDGYDRAMAYRSPGVHRTHFQRDVLLRAGEFRIEVLIEEGRGFTAIWSDLLAYRAGMQLEHPRSPTAPDGFTLDEFL